MLTEDRTSQRIYVNDKKEKQNEIGKDQVSRRIYLPVVCSSSAVPDDNDFLCAFKVSHGPYVTLTPVLKNKFTSLVVVFSLAF